jgi:hypothetical protein
MCKTRNGASVVRLLRIYPRQAAGSRNSQQRSWLGLNRSARNSFRNYPCDVLASFDTGTPFSICCYLRRAGWLRLNGSALLSEKCALLDHAYRRRRIAREIEHARATERLIAMAQKYEDRAAMFGEEERKLQRPGCDPDDLDETHAKI